MFVSDKDPRESNRFPLYYRFFNKYLQFVNTRSRLFIIAASQKIVMIQLFRFFSLCKNNLVFTSIFFMKVFFSKNKKLFPQFIPSKTKSSSSSAPQLSQIIIPFRIRLYFLSMLSHLWSKGKQE